MFRDTFSSSNVRRKIFIWPETKGMADRPTELCTLNMVGSARPPDPPPLQGLHCYYRAIRPQSPASVLSPRGFRRLCFSLRIRKLVPAVPRKSLCPTRAPYTPAAVRSVIRLPADLSQEKKAPLILTTFDTLTTRHRWVCFRSPFGHSPAPGLAWDFSSDANHHVF